MTTIMKLDTTSKDYENFLKDSTRDQLKPYWEMIDRAKNGRPG
ncbi:hypothetical protein COLO4_36846 [Corchorus olitorius]|uniref:Uncharacterized protein n=1 Tax=Corchorus olitorius TaxID=93759 RepID=A0A1R3G511_9ROSI|nr:hypothetical protein COLO4_36846 [Corchorus olitorius]